MSDRLRIWVAPEAGDHAKGFVPGGRGADAVLEELDPAKLNANLKALAAKLDTVLAGVETGNGYRLKSIKVGLEVTAEAGVNLIGTVTAGGKAAITLSFERV